VQLDTAFLSAFAALAGSAIGGATSFISAWLSHGAQLRAQLLLNDKSRREELYREFVEDASRLYIDALTRDTADLSKAITLYAHISRMRILSSPRVIEEADKVALLIIDYYPEPNKSFEDVRAMINQHELDPLRKFSEACRDELQTLPR
jgi:hypothetical protein